MATTTSHKAFALEFDHDYFGATSTRLGEIIEIEPTPSCAELLRGARMVFRKTGAGAIVMYQSNSSSPGSPMVSLSDDTTFNFTFSIKELVEFLNYSNLDASLINTYKPGKVVYLTFDVLSNSSSTPTLVPSLLDAYTRKKFNNEFSGLTANVTHPVLVKDANGTAVAGIYGANGNNPLAILADANGTIVAPVDLTKLPNGKYELFINNVSVFTFWAEDGLAGKNPMGIISIKYTEIDRLTSIPPVLPVTFRHNFLARQTLWRYYILIKKPVPVNFYATPNNHFFTITTAALPGITFASDISNNGMPTTMPNVQFDGIVPIVFTSNNPIAM
ncbi:MAG: hypothetical protein ACRCYO_03550, partial [Bacteroidia bacterium]